MVAMHAFLRALFHRQLDTHTCVASTLAETVPELERQDATVNIVVMSDSRLDDTVAHMGLDEVEVAFQDISISRIHRWMRPRVLFRTGDLVRLFLNQPLKNAR